MFLFKLINFIKLQITIFSIFYYFNIFLNKKHFKK